jgi:hypothetical protein
MRLEGYGKLKRKLMPSLGLELRPSGLSYKCQHHRHYRLQHAVRLQRWDFFSRGSVRKRGIDFFRLVNLRLWRGHDI